MLNLLPWRETKQNNIVKNFGLIIVGLLLINILLGMVVNSKLKQKSLFESSHQTHLQQQLNLLQQQIARGKLLQSSFDMLSVQVRDLKKIQAHNKFILSFMARLAEIMPSQVYLSSLAIHAEEILLEGNAVSFKSVRTLVEKINAAKIFDHTEVNILQHDNTSEEPKFTVHCYVR